MPPTIPTRFLPLRTLAVQLVGFPLLLAAQSSMFDYDQTLPLNVTVASTSTTDLGVTVSDITFSADPTAPTKPTRAFLISPPASAPPRAGILWCHWLGEPETTNRTQFLAEAITWAAHGVTSVLPDTMWAAPDWYKNRDLTADADEGRQQVIAFRRALDLLLSHPGVDPAHSALVAHDYSAMYGSIALASDRRIHHAVFIAAAPDLEDWAFYLQKPSDLAAYRAQNRPLNVVEHLRQLDGLQVLVQFAGDDFYVPPARAQVFVEALAATKTVKTYPEAKHDMTHPAAIRADRTAWLADALAVHP